MSSTYPRTGAAIAGVALAITLLCGGQARAQILGALPFGVHFDLEACLEGDDDACARAALEMGHGGWEAYLLGVDAPEGLGGDALAIYRQLGCAASEAADCALLGDEALEGGGRFRAAMLYLEACSLGESTGCLQFERTILGHQQIDEFKTTLTSIDRETYGLADDTPAGVKALKKIASRCDGKKGTLDDCVSLARTYNSRRSVADRQQVESGLEEVCSKHGSASACALLGDIRDIDQHWDPRMHHSVDLLAELCFQGSVEKACFAAGRALDSGRGLAFGSYASRNFDGYACDGGEGAGCERLTSAYESGLADVFLDTCRGIRNGAGGDPRACIETYTIHTFGVGAEKNEVLAGQLKAIACDSGAFRACVWLGNDAWGEDDQQAAAEWYRKACDGGDAVSCGVIGRMMIKGESNVPQDVSAGNELTRRGCDDNAGNACFELGFSYSQERGLSRDSTMDAEMYAKACSLGYYYGCSSLGVLFMDVR
ncbi:MAG: tetratricopeptide repeat protein, partial [Myxococcota bacterium]|nr:tetratricopeptide repeat protein [Myxococcota bacterium]